MTQLVQPERKRRKNEILEYFGINVHFETTYNLSSQRRGKIGSNMDKVECSRK